MGWGGGSSLARDVWRSVRRFIPEHQLQGVARDIVELFESRDCDTMDEAEQLMKDAGLENRADE